MGPRLWSGLLKGLTVTKASLFLVRVKMSYDHSLYSPTYALLYNFAASTQNLAIGYTGNFYFGSLSQWKTFLGTAMGYLWKSAATRYHWPLRDSRAKQDINYRDFSVINQAVVWHRIIMYKWSNSILAVHWKSFTVMYLEKPGPECLTSGNSISHGSYDYE